MLALPISKPRFKSIILNQNSPKIKLFLQNNANFRALGAPPPDPRASGGWVLCPQTPASGDWGLRPQTSKTAPHYELLATRLDHTKGMFYSFVVGLHPTLAQKIGLRFSEDLFFFALQLILGKKLD